MKIIKEEATALNEENAGRSDSNSGRKSEGLALWDKGALASRGAGMILMLALSRMLHACNCLCFGLIFFASFLVSRQERMSPKAV